MTRDSMWGDFGPEQLAKALDEESDALEMSTGDKRLRTDQIVTRSMRHGALAALNWALKAVREHGVEALEAEVQKLRPEAGEETMAFIVELGLTPGSYDPDALRGNLEAAINAHAEAEKLLTGGDAEVEALQIVGPL